MGKWLILTAPILLGGCIGFDRAGSFTSDNFGLNLATAPTPTIAISYSRQEGAIEPVFENGTTPSIAASVRHTGGSSVLSLGDKVSSIFAGGNAAVWAAGEKPTNGLAAVACVSTAVSQVYHPGAVAPLVFGTDTVIGLHVAFPAGPSQPQIVSGNLGYKRFEVAVAPVFSSPDGCTKQQLLDLAIATKTKTAEAVQSNQTDPVQKAQDIAADKLAALQVDERTRELNDANVKGLTAVYVPSTLAIANDDIGATAGSPANAGTVSIAQVFATGKAAEVIASTSALGSIGAVAAAARTTAASGPVFNVSEKMLPAAGDTVSISPAMAINKAGTPLTSFTYQCKTTDQPPAVAAGLATTINGSETFMALGVTAKATGSQVALTVPTNLGSLANPLSWTATNSKSGNVTVQMAQPAS